MPKKTLADTINALKEDGLVVGATSRPKSGRSYEVYNLDEIIAIGFRARSEKAIAFQRWSIGIIKNQLRLQQSQLDYFWDKEDQKDLYR